MSSLALRDAILLIGRSTPNDLAAALGLSRLASVECSDEEDNKEKMRAETNQAHRLLKRAVYHIRAQELRDEIAVETRQMMSRVSKSRRLQTAPSDLLSLPAELLMHVVLELHTDQIAKMALTARTFPAVCEGALRMRARARCETLPELPPSATWRGLLLHLEREKAAKRAAAADGLINLKVCMWTGQEIYFKCKFGTPLQKLLVALCNRQGISLNAITAFFDGDEFYGSETPLDLGMEDGDVIDVAQATDDDSESDNDNGSDSGSDSGSDDDVAFFP